MIDQFCLMDTDCQMGIQSLIQNFKILSTYKADLKHRNDEQNWKLVQQNPAISL